MWIGRPGALRQIRDGAARFDRAPDVGVSEFRALGGGITTWAAPVQPRRVAVSWSGMERDDVAHLDRLARRVDGPGPVAVLDPLSVNLLGSLQSEGRGSGRQWSVSTGGLLAPGGSSYALVDASAGTELSWTHPVWPGFPVTPGLVCHWWAPNFASLTDATTRLYWRDAGGIGRRVSFIESSRGVLTAQTPADMAYVTPMVRFESSGLHSILSAVFSIEAPDTTVPPPLGDGCPAMSITGYTHAPMKGNGAYRDIGLDLVEVTSSAGG